MRMPYHPKSTRQKRYATPSIHPNPIQIPANPISHSSAALTASGATLHASSLPSPPTLGLLLGGGGGISSLVFSAIIL